MHEVIAIALLVLPWSLTFVACVALGANRTPTKVLLALAFHVAPLGYIPLIFLCYFATVNHISIFAHEESFFVMGCVGLVLQIALSLHIVFKRTSLISSFRICANLSPQFFSFLYIFLCASVIFFIGMKLPAQGWDAVDWWLGISKWILDTHATEDWVGFYYDARHPVSWSMLYVYFGFAGQLAESAVSSFTPVYICILSSCIGAALSVNVLTGTRSAGVLLVFLLLSSPLFTSHLINYGYAEIALGVLCMSALCVNLHRRDLGGKLRLALYLVFLLSIAAIKNIGWIYALSMGLIAAYDGYIRGDNKQFCAPFGEQRWGFFGVGLFFVAVLSLWLFSELVYPLRLDRAIDDAVWLQAVANLGSIFLVNSSFSLSIITYLTCSILLFTSCKKNVKIWIEPLAISFLASFCLLAVFFSGEILSQRLFLYSSTGNDTLGSRTLMPFYCLACLHISLCGGWVVEEARLHRLP